MTTTSCVIIARGRLDHLRRVLVGLGRQTVEPDEVVVVAMGDPEVETLAAAHAVVTAVESVPCPPGDPLPLARARNHGASSTSGELLVFLDVDCIPARALVADYHHHRRPGLLMGTVRYLPPGVPSATGTWDDQGLRQHGRPHGARPVPTTPERTDRYELFWSLNFAVERATWEAVGGFDEGYRGYGGEDTDFAFEARRRGVDAWFLPGAEAFHQHHPVSSPPVEHLGEIVINAERFHHKWGTWPMTGWLEAFVAAGLITWTDDSIDLVPERSRQ
jgi:hypothetical protein